MDKQHKDRLDKIYQNMRSNMAKVDMLSMYSHEMFADFPKNLISNSYNELQKDVSILNKVKERLSPEEFNLLTEDDFRQLGMSNKFHRFFDNVVFMQLGDNKIESIEFEQVLYRQELISLYSFLEGYFQDIQRLLFEHDKKLLSNKDKEIAINKILEADNYSELISSIIEDKLAKSGYEKISSIIQKWKKEPFKLIIKLKKEELQQIDKFTCIRNIIIHNNSKINNDLLSFIDKEKYKHGQIFKLDSPLMKRFKDLVFNIVFQVYIEICSRYPVIVIENDKHGG